MLKLQTYPDRLMFDCSLITLQFQILKIQENQKEAQIINQRFKEYRQRLLPTSERLTLQQKHIQQGVLVL